VNIASRWVGSLGPLPHQGSHIVGNSEIVLVSTESRLLRNIILILVKTDMEYAGSAAMFYKSLLLESDLCPCPILQSVDCYCNDEIVSRKQK
jgi:hypothetical protein